MKSVPVSKPLLSAILVVAITVALLSLATVVLRHYSKLDAADVLQRIAVSAAALTAAVQLFQANRTLRDKLILDQHRSLFDFQSRMLDNEELAKVLFKAAASDNKTLSDLEVVQLFWLLAHKFSHLETVFLLSRGRLENNDVNSWLLALRTSFSDQVLRAYWEIDKGTYVLEFQEAVDDLLQTGRDKPAALKQFSDRLRG